MAPFTSLIEAGRVTESDLADMFNERGKAEFVNGLYDEAIIQYDLAIQIKPDFAEAYYNRGVAREALGRFTEARQDFDRARVLGYGRLGQL